MAILTVWKRNNVQENLKKYYGFDEMASWRGKDFLSKRESIFNYWINECGWKPINWR